MAHQKRPYQESPIRQPVFPSVPMKVIKCPNCRVELAAEIDWFLAVQDLRLKLDPKAIKLLKRAIDEQKKQFLRQNGG